MIDWSKIRKDFDSERRKATGSITGKELMQKAYSEMQAIESSKELKKAQLAVLKPMLLHYMVNKLPLVVRHPIQNPTESMGGASPDDSDGFYHTVQKSEGVSFEETMETIPVGTELTYFKWDKPMGQWIFKGSNGREYAIYDKNVIMFKGSSIENPGFYGLLYYTNIVDSLNN
jgi:hypothetical protein